MSDNCCSENNFHESEQTPITPDEAVDDSLDAQESSPEVEVDDKNSINSSKLTYSFQIPNPTGLKYKVVDDDQEYLFEPQLELFMKNQDGEFNKVIPYYQNKYGYIPMESADSSEQRFIPKLDILSSIISVDIEDSHTPSPSTSTSRATSCSSSGSDESMSEECTQETIEEYCSELETSCSPPQNVEQQNVPQENCEVQPELFYQEAPIHPPPESMNGDVFVPQYHYQQQPIFYVPSGAHHQHHPQPPPQYMVPYQNTVPYTIPNQYFYPQRSRGRIPSAMIQNCQQQEYFNGKMMEMNSEETLKNFMTENNIQLEPATLESIRDSVHPNKFPKKVWLLATDKRFPFITWNSNGNGILINECGMVPATLKLFFRSDKYNSFLRQLHLYGFHKINRTRTVTRVQPNGIVHYLRTDYISEYVRDQNFDRNDIEKVGYIVRDYTRRSNYFLHDEDDPDGEGKNPSGSSKNSGETKRFKKNNEEFLF